MRVALAIILALLSSQASAATVRVKSQHPTAQVAGTPTYKLGAEEVLRGATIGPTSVRVVLRRLADPNLPPIAVKLMRDGREVARLLVGGKPVDRVAGESALASARVEKDFEVPGGPHAIYVEVGQGAGQVLVSFEEPEKVSLAALSKKPPRRKRVPKEKKPRAAKPQAGAVAAGQQPAEAPGEDESAEEEAVDADEAPEEDGAASAVAASPDETVSLARLTEEELPATPASEPVVVKPVEQPGPTGPARFLVGLRAGGVGQLQLGAGGVAAGLSARWAPLGGGAGAGSSGLLVGLSADFVRYGASWGVPGSGALPAYSHELTVTSVPALAELSWSFGGGLLTPLAGVSVGATVASLGSTSSVEQASATRVLLTAGLHAGVELPIGADRLGLEVRYLHASTGGDDELARDLQVGGLLAQATWRFGL